MLFTQRVLFQNLLRITDTAKTQRRVERKQRGTTESKETATFFCRVSSRPGGARGLTVLLHLPNNLSQIRQVADVGFWRVGLGLASDHGCRGKKMGCVQVRRHRRSLHR